MRLIDADELITAFPCGETVRTECVRATIKHMPTSEERKGKWIWQWDKFDIDTANEAVCSKCKKISAMPVGYFCKWCGADMREQP